MYLALLRIHWKSFGRSLEGRRLWLIALGLLPLVTYIVFVLVGLGIYFNKLMRVAHIADEPLSLLNSSLLSVFFGLLGFRFFFQRPPRMAARPYLHLPIERRHLVRYFQAASVASLHNLYPLLFFLPFWMRHVRPEVAAPAHAYIWLGGILLCLLLSHFLNTLIRVHADQHGQALLLGISALVGFELLDQTLGWHFLPRVSSLLFDGLAAGNLGLLIGLAVLTAAGTLAAGRALRNNLRRKPDSAANLRLRLLPGTLRFGRSPIRNLIVLELLMMWRNKRSRQYVLISVGVSTAYTALLLSDFNALSGSLMAAAVGLFASGVFALNYGQLMFAWESHYFDGLLARNIAPQHMMLAKFMVLQGSCLMLFLISLPLFIWLAPDLLMLHVAFLFYNAGVTSILMLALAVFNRRRVSVSEGSFFNYQGFSILHWLWIIPTILPPAVLLFMLESRPEMGLSLVATIGLVSMLLAWPSTNVLAHVLARRKYRMAAGFRSYDR